MWRLPLGSVLVAFGATAQDPWSERLLATVPAGLAFESTPVTAPDGSQQVEHTRCVFGRDGRFVVYCAYRGARGVAMVGERIVGEFDYLHDPVVDVLREHHAFRAGNRIRPDKEQWHAIVDGEMGTAYDWIGVVSLGRGGVPAFWEQPGAKVQGDGAYSRSAQQFHVGARTGKKHDDGLSLGLAAWNSDGTRVVTAAEHGGAWSLLTADAKAERLDKKSFTFVQDVAISPDGKRVATTAVEGGPPLEPGEPPMPGEDAGKRLLVVDGDRVADGLDGFAPPVFSGNAKRYAFVFLRGEKMGVALDNDKQPRAEHDFAGQPAWSPAGNAMCFVTGAGNVEASARFHARDVHAMAGVTFALRQRRVPGDKVETIADGCAGLAHATFGPLPQQIAYVRKADGQWRLVVGTAVSDPFDEVDKPQFRDDGKMVAFGARKGRELWWKVMALP